MKSGAVRVASVDCETAAAVPLPLGENWGVAVPNTDPEPQRPALADAQKLGIPEAEPTSAPPLPLLRADPVPPPILRVTQPLAVGEKLALPETDIVFPTETLPPTPLPLPLLLTLALRETDGVDWGERLAEAHTVGDAVLRTVALLSTDEEPQPVLEAAPLEEALRCGDIDALEEPRVLRETAALRLALGLRDGSTVSEELRDAKADLEGHAPLPEGEGVGLEEPREDTVSRGDGVGDELRAGEADVLGQIELEAVGSPRVPLRRAETLPQLLAVTLRLAAAADGLALPERLGEPEADLVPVLQADGDAVAATALCVGAAGETVPISAAVDDGSAVDKEVAVELVERLLVNAEVGDTEGLADTDAVEHPVGVVLAVVSALPVGLVLKVPTALALCTALVEGEPLCEGEPLGVGETEEEGDVQLLGFDLPEELPQLDVLRDADAEGDRGAEPETRSGDCEASVEADGALGEALLAAVTVLPPGPSEAESTAL